MRVLLVEDDPTTSKSIEMMLTHANLNVYTTDLGEEGIDLAKLYDYDLILLDLGLPDMNGHDVLRQLRLGRVDTPILILSGETDTENKIRGFGFGADDYMTKPFHREELVARIHAIVRRSQGHAQSGPVAVWCRSFDSIMCSKGDELWAQEERMNFAKTRCELH